MKIYTKTGDKGSTCLIGGTRVPKNNKRLEAYGGVDELNSYLGLIRSYPIKEELKEEIIGIQKILFAVGGNLATDIEVCAIKPELMIKAEQISFLEQAIDKMTAQLPLQNTFLLPGGDLASSSAHIARTVCRRVERRILDMQEEYPINEMTLKYINRLSDYLFVLARQLSFDAGKEEIGWIPEK